MRAQGQAMWRCNDGTGIGGVLYFHLLGILAHVEGTGVKLRSHILGHDARILPWSAPAQHPFVHGARSAGFEACSALVVRA